MRIIGGELKGRQIVPPRNFSARPTTDFAKEGLFNTLSNIYDFEETVVLDLFSGTGGISLEFASRGCKSVTAVEMNVVHANFIKSTAAALKVNGLNVVRHNVFDFLNICRIKFDVIFADPPYDIDNLAGIPDKILNASILKEDGLLIFEHPAAFNFTSHQNFIKEKRYGNVHFTFFKILHQ
jgi:16S rRNA (guanine(966)-N(2))-methyltransferase RsmD